MESVLGRVSFKRKGFKIEVGFRVVRLGVVVEGVVLRRVG